MKTLARVGLALSLLALTISASAASRHKAHPRSFDYYDENGVEITGIDLNLGRVAHDHFSLRHFTDGARATQPRSFQYVDGNGTEVTGIDLNLERFSHHHFRMHHFG